MEAAGKLNMDEYGFFLRGGVVLDREGQMDNPCSSWLSEQQWDNITELDKPRVVKLEKMKMYCKSQKWKKLLFLENIWYNFIGNFIF